MSTPDLPDAAPAADAPAPIDAVTSIQPPAWEPPAPHFELADAQTSAGPESASALALTGPRVRWAGIVWGLVFALIAAGALWLLVDPARQAALSTWLIGLTPASALAVVALVVGGFALIAGLVGIARRAQRGLERRRAASVPPSA
ncbi:hypothetical protein [Microbacterium timonense]|uniref:hypothetical protein n=1 Tax=Microbacterium timonense TaxID=2086576 RepID=UPI001F2AE835|nr:hypothetical protein [Microbacterium timonense]